MQLPKPTLRNFLRLLAGIFGAYILSYFLFSAYLHNHNLGKMIHPVDPTASVKSSEPFENWPSYLEPEERMDAPNRFYRDFYYYLTFADDIIGDLTPIQPLGGICRKLNIDPYIYSPSEYDYFNPPKTSSTILLGYKFKDAAGKEETFIEPVSEEAVASKEALLPFLDKFGEKTGSFTMWSIIPHFAATIVEGNIVNGHTEGLMRTFYKTPGGQYLAAEQNYSNNLKNGKSVLYYLDGSINAVGFWEDGKRNGSWKVFYPSKQDALHLNYVNDRLEGSAQVFDLNGTMLCSGNYREGKPYTGLFFANPWEIVRPLNSGESFLLKYQKGELVTKSPISFSPFKPPIPPNLVTPSKN